MSQIIDRERDWAREVITGEIEPSQAGQLGQTCREFPRKLVVLQI